MTNAEEYELSTPDWQVGLPGDVASVLEQFILDARAALGADLDSIILFGSAAEGRLRPASDINVIVVMNRFDESIVNEWRSALQIHVAAVDLQPMFLLKDELQEASEAFAVKFSDVLTRSRVLYGNDPFSTLSISRDATIRRAQQVLLNLTIRLRHAMLIFNEGGQTHMIVDSIGPLRATTMVLLQLEGKKVQSPRDAFLMLGNELGAQWQATLQHLREMREQGMVVDPNAAHTLHAMSALTALLFERSKKLN